MESVDVSDVLGFSQAIAVDGEQGEILFVGNLGAAVTDLAGRFLNTWHFHDAPRLTLAETGTVAVQRTRAGWQCLEREETGFVNRILGEDGGNHPVDLPALQGEVETVAWTPCGDRLAVTLAGLTDLLVFDTHRGELLWHQRTLIEPSDRFGAFCRHVVQGWEVGGDRLITALVGEFGRGILVWDGEGGQRRLAITA